MALFLNRLSDVERYNVSWGIEYWWQMPEEQTPEWQEVSELVAAWRRDK